MRLPRGHAPAPPGRRKVLDTSTAHRTDPGWDYGFPELKGQQGKIQNACRVAVPGCHATGFIAIARPLVELGLRPGGLSVRCTASPVTPAAAKR